MKLIKAFMAWEGMPFVVGVLLLLLTYSLSFWLAQMGDRVDQAVLASWHWLTTWPLDKVLAWSAAALTIYGAWLLANPGHRWTAWGFVFFLGANALWLAYAWRTDQGSIFVQQAVLTLISLQGIWNQLLRPVWLAVNQLFESFES